MLAGTPPSLLFEWLEYFQIEPFGEERADIRNAVLCLLVANAVGGKKGGGQFKIDDFMPKFNQADKPTFDPNRFKQLMKKRYGNDSKSGS